MNSDWIQPAVFALIVGVISYLLKQHLDQLKETIKNLTTQVAELQKALWKETISRQEADEIFNRLRAIEVACASQHGNKD